MTTASEKQELREQLKRDGKMEFFYNPPPKAQYWRSDGTPLPNLLPSDAYGMQRYLKKGFTLTPPEHPTPSVEPYPDTVMPLGTPAKIDRVEAIATVKEERKQALHEEAATGFENQTVATPSMTEEEKRALYEEWKRLYEEEQRGLVEAQAQAVSPVVGSHPHRFKTARLGAACLVEGCEVKRQRKPAKRRSS